MNGKRRILHTMLRIKEVEGTLNFYVNLLGMRLLRRDDYSEGRFSLLFVGYEAEEDGTVLEFTHNWDVGTYDLGDAYGHIALSAPDIYELCKDLEENGAKILRPPGPMKHGTRVIAFVEDPNGYKIELIQRD